MYMMGRVKKKIHASWSDEQLRKRNPVMLIWQVMLSLWRNVHNHKGKKCSHQTDTSICDTKKTKGKENSVILSPNFSGHLNYSLTWHSNVIMGTVVIPLTIWGTTNFMYTNFGPVDTILVAWTSFCMYCNAVALMEILICKTWSWTRILYSFIFHNQQWLRMCVHLCVYLPVIC